MFSIIIRIMQMWIGTKMRYHLIPVGMAITQKTRNSTLVRLWRKKELYSLLGECRLVQPLWKTVWRFLKKWEIEFPHDPAISLLGIYPKKLENSERCMHPHVHCSIICNSQDTETTRVVHWWMDGCVCILKYYSAIKKWKRFMITWMDLKDIMLRENLARSETKIYSIFQRILWYFLVLKKRIAVNIKSRVNGNVMEKHFLSLPCCSVRGRVYMSEHIWVSKVDPGLTWVLV